MSGSRGYRPSAVVIAPGEWRPAGIEDLEPAAWSALQDTGSTAVAAGPGAGKTEFLAQRAAYLLQTGMCAHPCRILAISYKRDAATNLSRRVAARVPDHAHRFVSMTFDAFTKGLVDRFWRALPEAWAMGDGGYDLEFWQSRALSDFLVEIAASAPPEMAGGLYSLRSDRFMPDVVGDWQLPGFLAGDVQTVEEYAAREWWRQQYIAPVRPAVNFTMLNRLAQLIVRESPQILNALRSTYPYVFVDEFQDTTAAQITLLTSVFGDPAVVTTAVGDRKQRIMKFAGALQDAMNRFEQEFGATRHQLTSNHRSSAGLVSVQQHVASRLDPASAPAVSTVLEAEAETPAQIWTFASSRDEAAYLADWVADDIARSERTAADFALLARQRVADYEPLLRQAFTARGIALRNDDTRYGTLTLQDLLKHDVTVLVLNVLRLAASERGLGPLWLETLALLSRIRGDDRSDVRARNAADELGEFVRSLREWLATADASTTDPSEVVQRAAAIVDPDQLAGFARAAHGGEPAAAVLQALTARLADVAPGQRDWVGVFGDVEAASAVTLMTIHRSKGLEYHSVVLLGLDDRQWWAHARDSEESTSAFFVAMSRAARRLIFTSTAPVAHHTGIGELYQLLDVAGVEETAWPPRHP